MGSNIEDASQSLEERSRTSRPFAKKQNAGELNRAKRLDALSSRHDPRFTLIFQSSNLRKPLIFDLQASAYFLSPFGNPLFTERCSTFELFLPPFFLPFSSLPLHSTTRFNSMIRSFARRLLSPRSVPHPPRILQTIHQQRPERIHNECRHGKRYLSSSRVVAGQVKEFKLADIGEGITECEIVKW